MKTPIVALVAVLIAGVIGFVAGGARAAVATVPSTARHRPWRARARPCR